MANPHYDGKWLYGKIKHGSDFRVIMKLYSGPTITNEHMAGFLCEAINLFGKPDNKQYVIEKAKMLIASHELPLVVQDLPYHVSRFKILITKNG